MTVSCNHPERKPAMGECSAEQKRICHGDPQCDQPHLRPANGKCSAEQIEKCHGRDK